MASETTPQVTITPYLSVRGAEEAIAFYGRALGAVEVHRLTCPQSGKVAHSCLHVGPARFFLSEEYPANGSVGPQALGGSPVTIHVQLPDVDATFRQAVEAGATPLMPPAAMFWGDRFARIEDPYGHRWSMATTVETLTPEQMEERMLAAMAPAASEA